MCYYGNNADEQEKCYEACVQKYPDFEYQHTKSID